MKAYKVTDRHNALDYSTVIFAENRNKAKSKALHSDAFEWCEMEYTDFSATRIPELDKFYRGKDELDWENDEDRILMVKEAKYVCSYEYDTEDLECKNCPAKQWCIRYHGAECEVTK